MNRKTALLAGATGLVGSALLQRLLQGEEYGKVHVITRRPLGINHPKAEEIICDFDHLEQVQEAFQVDDVFCCLGTTIKKAKTKSAMFKVDVEYPLAMARLAHKQGAGHFLVISSMKANPKSLFFYFRIKGILEREVSGIPFQRVSIFRPSLLLGERREFRFAENAAGKMVKGLSFLLKPAWRSRLAVEAGTVAEAMVQAAQQDGAGVQVYEAPSIEEMAG
jgi:uncharacterized protein YbjT (DUF2867 family)